MSRSCRQQTKNYTRGEEEYTMNFVAKQTMSLKFHVLYSLSLSTGNIKLTAVEESIHEEIDLAPAILFLLTSRYQNSRREPYFESAT